MVVALYVHSFLADFMMLLLRGRGAWARLILSAFILGLQCTLRSYGQRVEPAPSGPYRYLKYVQMVERINEVAERYPDIVEVFDALEVWPGIADFSKEDLLCGKERCKFLVMRLGNRAVQSDTTPEVFFSGELHGNERVGPNTLIAMVSELARRYYSGEPQAESTKEVRWLIDSRSTYIIPMANAYGYYHSVRYEKIRQRDANRDFPYQQRSCMATITARVINELFRRHLFQLSVTFHGGVKVLSYAWGSNNHIKAGKSTNAPDLAAIVDVATLMRDSAGRTAAGDFWYPMGTMTDTVYAVDGGMEDWSYGAGFEEDPDPINQCEPPTYGGYPRDRTNYSEFKNIRSVTYLVEMSSDHTPSADTLGNKEEMWTEKTENGNHINRNAHLSMSVMEMVAPSIMWRIGDSDGMVQDGKLRNVSWYALGCNIVDTLEVWLLPGECSAEAEVMLGLGVMRQWPPPGAHRLGGTQFSNVTCRHLSLWNGEELSDANVKSLEGIKLPESLPGGDYCLTAVAEFDKSWNKTDSPDPNVPPWSHLVNSRVQDHYSWNCEAPSRIESSRRRMYVATPSSASITVKRAPRPTTHVVSESPSEVPPSPTKAVWQTVRITMEFLRMPSRVPMIVEIDPTGKRGSLKAKLVGNQRLARGTYMLAVHEFGDRTNRGKKTEVLTVEVERQDQSIDEEFTFDTISGADLSGHGIVLEWYPRKLRTGGGEVGDGGKDFAWAVIPTIAGGVDPDSELDLICEWSGGQGYVEVVSKDVEGVLCGVNRTRAPVEIRADCCSELLTAGEPFGVTMDESEKLAVNFRFGEAGRSACRACSAGDKLILRMAHKDHKECVLGRFSAEDSELAGEVDCSVLKSHIGSSLAVTGIASNFAALLMVIGGLSIICWPVAWCVSRYKRLRRREEGWRKLGGNREMVSLRGADDEGSLVESPVESSHGGIPTDGGDSGVPRRVFERGPME